MRTRPVRSLLASSLTLLVIAASATACGDDGDEKSDDDTRSSESPSEVASPTTSEPVTGALTAEQVEKAAITLENLGEGWKLEPDDGKEDEDAPGCLGDIDRLTESLDKVEEFKADYGYGDEGLPQVSTGVKTYADEAALTTLFDQFQTELEKCTSVSWEDDGTTVELTLSITPDLQGVEVDDQTSFVATGQLKVPSGETSPISLYGSYARVGSTVTTTGTTSLSEIPSEHEAWAVIGMNRLSAVVAGEEPAETVAPQP